MAVWLCLLHHPHDPSPAVQKDPKRGSLLAGAQKLDPNVALPHFFGSGHLFLVYFDSGHIAFGHVIALGCRTCRGWALFVSVDIEPSPLRKIASRLLP